MDKYLKVLKKCSLFYGIEEENLIRMLSCLDARVEQFGKKYTVFSEGTPARFIGILLSGTVQIVQNDYFGNRSLIAKISEGEIFGEAFACAAVSALPVSVIASEVSEVILIDCSHILHTCSNACGFHQKLIFNLMKALADKNLSYYQKLSVTSKRSTREKLIAYLMQVAKKEGKNVFEIPFDRQELADYLEVDRSGLSAEISKLRQEGILESRRKHFRLLSR